MEGGWRRWWMEVEMEAEMRVVVGGGWWWWREERGGGGGGG